MNQISFEIGNIRKKKRTQKRIKFWIVFSAETVLVIVLAWLFVKCFLTVTTMPDDSMSNVVGTNNTILIQRFTYKFTAPKRFDVIAFSVDDARGYYQIKRIIGLPGERVSIHDGAVYINGKQLNKDIYGDSPIQLAGLAEEEIILDNDEYFVLGDNRNDSEDSRFSNVGNVSRKRIIGKAEFITKPFRRIK